MSCRLLIAALAVVAALSGCAAPGGSSVDRGGGVEARARDGVVQYRRYVATQVDALGPQARRFADAVKARDVNRAKALFPVVRAPWERIEPIAESFGDLDARMDGRQDTVRPPGAAFTGFHRLEKDLWADGLQPDSSAVADRLLADVADLQARAPGVELTPTRLADGATELLEEVSIVKLTGDEDVYASCDLWDIDANVEGSSAVVRALRPAIDGGDPTLGPRLDQQFADVRRMLDAHRVGDGFRPYRELTAYDREKMSIAIDALGQSVGRVADAVGS
jgi:iron uptake system component EfeO